MMQIDAQHYVLFYEDLRSKYFEEECKTYSPSSILTRDIWKKEELNSEGKMKLVTSRLFYLTSYDYLFRKYDAAKKLPKEAKIPIRELTLYAGLAYLGLKPGNKFLKSTSNEEKAKSLLESFLSDKKLDTKEPDNNKRPEKNKTRTVNSGNLDIIHSIIKDFFQKINTGKYFDAWLLLTPHYQLKGPWKGNYFHFINCFSTVEMISDIKLYEFNFFKSSITSRIFYKQTSLDFPITTYEIDQWEMGEYDEARVYINTPQKLIDREDDFEDDFDEKESELRRSEYRLHLKMQHVKKLIKQLRNKIDQGPFSKGDVSPEKIRVSLYFLFGENKNYLEEMFPNCHKDISSIDGECSFYYFQERWLINNISGIHPLLHI